MSCDFCYLSVTLLDNQRTAGVVYAENLAGSSVITSDRAFYAHASLHKEVLVGVHDLLRRLYIGVEREELAENVLCYDHSVYFEIHEKDRKSYRDSFIGGRCGIFPFTDGK